MAAAALAERGGGKSPSGPGDCVRWKDERCCCCCWDVAPADMAAELSAARTFGELAEVLPPERRDRRRRADARIVDGADDTPAARSAVVGVDWVRAGERGGSGGPRNLLPTGSTTDAGMSGGNSGVFERGRFFCPLPSLLATPTLCPDGARRKDALTLEATRDRKLPLSRLLPLSLDVSEPNPRLATAPALVVLL